MLGGFGFNEAQEMFRKEVRSFAQKELALGAKERAKLDFVPREIIKKVAGLGLMGLNVPEEYGGHPADWVMVGIAIEELAKVDFAASRLPPLPISAWLVLRHGSEELRADWVPALVKGDKSLCLALTEPDCGSDAAAIKTRAQREGNFYIINGSKTAIAFGMDAQAAILFAKTEPKAGARGISCFLVPLDLPGITRSFGRYMGQNHCRPTSIAIDNARVPANHRVGEEGKGFSMVMAGFDFLRAGPALRALGQAEASLEEAIAYAKQRTAFGQPIARYEGISFKIAEDATLIEAARLLSYRTLWLRDRGLPHTKEAAMCKWLSVKVAIRAIHDALLIHGHVGYSEECPIEQRLRDVIGLELAEGTPEIMKTVISRELLR